MRKRMLILMIVFLVSTIGSSAMVGYLLYRERNVTADVTTRYGDESAAEGLEISFIEYPKLDDEEDIYSAFKRISDRQWKNTITFQGGKSRLSSDIFRETDAILEQEKQYKDREDFLFKMNGNNVYGGGYGIQAQDISDRYTPNCFPDSLIDAVCESDTPLVVRLSDYVKYYPILDTMELPAPRDDIYTDRQFVEGKPLKPAGNIIRGTDQYEEREESEKYDAPENRFDYSEVKEIARKFEEFFRIPVIAEDERRLEGSNDYGYPEIEQVAVGKDCYEPKFTSSVTEEAMYFTFNTHTDGGSVVDTSLIPGGYGIYRLPYRVDREAGTTTVLIDDMKLFVPLSPEADHVDIMIDNDQKNMMIYYSLNGVDQVQFIDLASGQCVCEIELGENVSERWFTFFDTSDDLFLLNLIPKNVSDEYNSYEERIETRNRTSKLYVIKRTENGQYEIVLSTNAFMEYMGGSYAFDGKRLAQAVIAYDDSMIVFVYSETGLDYKGEFRFSLGKAVSVTEGSDSWGGIVETWDLQCQWR
ncbi:MAG: hypothetical protein IKI15_07585 [Lachnospiraceae bacterium]|nr:hypothetical protein [Lachnospiraceae bacterium]